MYSKAILAAAAKIKRWRDEPVFFVTDELKAQPDTWQLEVLNSLADPSIQRIGMKACVGPGKSAVEAWIAWYFLATQGNVGQHPKGAAVSITADNLKDNLWAEIKKWQLRSQWLSAKYTWQSERVFCNDHPETWFISARSWAKTANAEEQAKTLSGLHSEYVLALIDESGAIPPPVANAAEQALSLCKWGKIVQAGNPISRGGMLYAACTSLRHLWKIVTVTGDPDDQNRSPRIDLVWAREQIRTHGRDNPWIQSQILGEFPPASINVLMGPEEVERAMTHTHMPEDYEHQQKRLGIDVAREGDDRTVLAPRQGLQAFPMVELRNQRGPQVAARAAIAKERWNWETAFVDNSGGFGGAVEDSMLQGGLSYIPVNFGGAADDSRYANKRAEMWFRMAEWLKRGGCLPNDPDMVRELTTPTFTWNPKGQFLIEPKDQIKKRLGFSPDKADALALTFAWAEMARQEIDGIPLIRQERVLSEFDPLRNLDRYQETTRRERVAV